MHKAELDVLSGLKLIFGQEDGFLFSYNFCKCFLPLKPASLRFMSFVNNSKSFYSATELNFEASKPRLGENDKQETWPLPCDSGMRG
jgi:hypothetical protein